MQQGRATRLFVNTDRHGVPAGRTPGRPGAGLHAPARGAAGSDARCFHCQCLECVQHCVYLEDYGAYPKGYIREIYNNEAIVMGAHQANILINTCSLCGQCEVFCPNDFSMADVCLEARRRMVGKTGCRRRPTPSPWTRCVPPRCELTASPAMPRPRQQPVLCFPGCQLAGDPARADPGPSIATCCLAEPDTGIWLDAVAGLPAHWAGRQEEFSGIGERFISSWREMGQPLILTCCSSCLQMFRDYLPEVAGGIGVDGARLRDHRPGHHRCRPWP